MNEDVLYPAETGNTPAQTDARTPEIIGAEIRALTGAMLSNAIEIGRRLCEAQELLPYGSFGEWVKTETGYSVSTANNFMRVYSEYGGQTSLFGAEADSQTFGKLSYSKALALLSVPSEERESFAQEVDAEHLSTRELERAIKKRDERIRELEEEAETSEEEHGKELRRIEEGYRKRISELESRPVEVAVQSPDPAEVEAAIAAALEKAKAESEAEKARLEAKLKARDAETKKLKAKVAVAEQAAEEARKAAETATGSAAAEARAQLAEAEAERLRKELAMADPVTAEFKGVFEQAAAIVPKLRALADRAPGDTAPKLRAAMAALAKQLSGDAGNT